MTPAVSVVMSVYNGQTYLAEAIGSILAQTFSDFEFIIVDDGSTDATAEIIESCRDVRIRCLRNGRNLGLAASLNIGIEAATGQYVARMDADDISRPDRLARQIAFMKSHSTVGVCGSWIEVVGDNVQQVWEYPAGAEEIHARLLFDCSMAHPTVLFDRARWIKARLFYDSTYTYAQDYELWCRAVRSLSLANVQEVLLVRRIHAGQIGQNCGNAQLEWAGAIRRRQLESLGLVPTEGQRVMHEQISTWTWPRTNAFVLEAETWLSVLRQANRTRGIFPEPAFSKVVGERWLAIAQSVDPGLSRRIWTSPLSESVDMGWRKNLLGRAWRGLFALRG